MGNLGDSFIRFLIVWLVPHVSKTKRIPSSDWLPERDLTCPPKISRIGPAGKSYLDHIIYYYIHTEKYSPKSYVVNFRTQISSSQSEERPMVFTREKKWYDQSESWTMFFHVWEKWYVQSEATEVCEFRAKIPAFYCSLQRRFAHIQGETFYSKSFAR